MNGWRAEAAARRGSGLGAGSSRRLSRAGRSRGSDAGGAKPPAGRPHGAERRGRGVRPVPRPRSAVPVAGARLGRGALPPADGGAPGGALLPRAGSCRSRPGRAAPGAAAVTVRRLAEAREPPSCSRVPRAAAAAAGGGGRAAGMTRLLSASVLVALSSTQTDGAASLSSKTQRWPGEWRAQGAPGWILLLAQGTQKICLPWSPTKPFSVQSPLSARSLEKLEKSPRDIFHPEIQKGSVNFKFGVLYAKDGQLTGDEMFSHVFAGALLTQALGKTSFGFLLSHWVLPSLAASGEIHPEPLQNQLKPRESHSQLSQDTRRRMGDVSEHLAKCTCIKTRPV
ncbi:uncharacterized protein LOC118686697 isoform X3 [Molothrus ater]|uniref:uncharacterized protein LOC118686697 isoform X3 n=1 Tax=Molothrus ater TaxID=84834 RepID=UPI0023E7E698|nr:uncharacterized protein LOC118686697 isoform X3 [Molothrus ater]